MGVSDAVQWWEESQLRFLVLASVVIQYFLHAASIARKFPIRSLFRPFIWLAYLGSDAIAIYALAALFNRHGKPHDHGDGNHGSNSILQVLWAPVLLIHLGGHDGITAYNIEDNELWTRHFVTAVSQITVSIYVFWKSWRGNDSRLLQAAIVLFIYGIYKCFERPLALSRASINSLVSSGDTIWRSINTEKLKIDPLEDFIDKATRPTGENGYLLTPATPVDFTPYRLFVDLASPSPDDRIRMLQSFSALDDSDAYCKLQRWLCKTFQLLYTKEKLFPDILDYLENPRTAKVKFSNLYVCAYMLRMLSGSLVLAAVALFHHSNREAYSAVDVKVTYALLSCTAAMEFWSFFAKMSREEDDDMVSTSTPVEPDFQERVSQHNLVGLLVRSREHPKVTSIMEFLRCDAILHQRWRMKSSSSSLSITKLVLKYVKGGWEHHIRDVSSYRKFNDNRGQLTLGHEGCYQELGWSLEGAFDESVLLWHLATDFCYYDMRSSQHGSRCTQDSCPHVFACPVWCHRSEHHKRAVQCREMSNYMMYLLSVNPEMLIAGTRRNLFTAAYEELKDITKEGHAPVDKIKLVQSKINPKGPRLHLLNIVRGIIFKGGNQCKKERQLTQSIIVAVDGGGSPQEGSRQGIIHDAWSIARMLSSLPEEKTWAVIAGVWVEMMCFSAARCRGYLHAKGLATGVEYLTYVWLLQYYMGMETLAAKLQRTDHHLSGREHGDDHSASRVRREDTEQNQYVGASSSGATTQDKAADQRPYQDSDATGSEIV